MKIRQVFFVLLSFLIHFSVFAEPYTARILRLVPDDEGVKALVKGTAFNNKIIAIYLSKSHKRFNDLEALLEQSKENKSVVIFDIQKLNIIFIQDIQVKK